MAGEPATERSTLVDVRTAAENRRGALGRRIALAVLLVIVVSALTSWLGVHSQTVTTTNDGYRLSLDYPRVARAGLDIPWILTLSHDGGFQGPVTVALTADYYDIFEFQGMHPEPSAQRSDGNLVYLTFDPPRGDVLRVSLDTYVQPASQIGRDATVQAIVQGRTVAQVHYSTLLVP